jgi:hypothetical protein
LAADPICAAAAGILHQSPIVSNPKLGHIHKGLHSYCRGSQGFLSGLQIELSVLQLKIHRLPFPQRLKIDPDQAYSMKINLPAILGTDEAEPTRVNDLIDLALHTDLPPS